MQRTGGCQAGQRMAQVVSGRGGTFQRKAAAVQKARGYVKTLLGRRKRLEAPRWAYKAVSGIIQGSAADILKYKLAELGEHCDREYNREIYPVISIHDDIVFEGDRELGYREMPNLIKIMEDVMGDPFNLTVPFVVDCSKAGYSWAAASFGEILI